jgi:hypothetical protein
VFGDELEGCVGNRWCCHGSVGQIHTHSSTSAILFEGRDGADARREAGRDPIQVVGDEVSTVTEGSEANQREFRSHGAKSTQKFLEVVAVAGPKVNDADSEPQSGACTAEWFGDPPEEESLDAPEKASWESDHGENTSE